MINECRIDIAPSNKVVLDMPTGAQARPVPFRVTPRIFFIFSMVGDADLWADPAPLINKTFLLV